MSKVLGKGHFETIVLKLLSEYDRMYGYEITQKVKNITNGSIQITEGALYPLLHRLESEGSLTATVVQEGNRMRKYYSLTKEGMVKKCTAVKELEQFINMLNVLINPIKNATR